MTLEKKESVMKIYKVSIYLKGEEHSNIGWLVGKTAAEVANKIRCQSMVLLAAALGEFEEAGYNMSEVQDVDGYNSSEIVKYYVEEYGVIPCSIK